MFLRDLIHDSFADLSDKVLKSNQEEEDATEKCIKDIKDLLEDRETKLLQISEDLGSAFANQKQLISDQRHQEKHIALLIEKNGETEIKFELANKALVDAQMKIAALEANNKMLTERLESTQRRKKREAGKAEKREKKKAKLTDSTSKATDLEKDPPVS